jgi:hypothetical protein
MKTNSLVDPSASSSASLSSSPQPTPSAGAPEAKTGPGRPSCLNERMIDVLCALIRETGISDSGAAARASLHPSTLSRWKKEFPDLAITLRSAREEFRAAQLSIIFETVHAGRATSWRAAAWLLERIFPHDYAPRAAERARFQEQFDAICAAEQEGGEISLPGRAEPLQNVKNSTPLPAPREAQARAAAPGAEPECDLTLPLTEAPRGGAKEFRLPETPLQNVKNPALAGPLCPPVLSTKTIPV